MAEKLRDAVVKFDTYRNVQRHRAVLPVIARLSCLVLLAVKEGWYLCLYVMMTRVPKVSAFDIDK